VPVPLHPKRKKQRGFNQAFIIAKELAMLKGIKLVEGQLVKLKNILPQTSLKAEDRQKNVKGAFGIKEREKIEGKIILLVDDVYTTGSTIRECSSVLKNAGAKDVRALTLARA
ncbi:MAG: ComF family protein, partial [Candidatus Aminicenantes bacterium]|nr:ComF family protein [Candidatus Aminicenantes bacterium]